MGTTLDRAPPGVGARGAEVHMNPADNLLSIEYRLHPVAMQHGRPPTS